MNATDQTHLNLDPLEKAIDFLRDALAKPMNPYNRYTTIYHFECTFDLCLKLLRRYLATQAAVYAIFLNDIFRQAGREGIIANVEAWLGYLKGRRLTSHACNEKTAEDLYQMVLAFLPDAQALLDELRRRCGTST